MRHKVFTGVPPHLRTIFARAARIFPVSALRERIFRLHLAVRYFATAAWISPRSSSASLRSSSASSNARRAWCIVSAVRARRHRGVPQPWLASLGGAAWLLSIVACSEPRSEVPTATGSRGELDVAAPGEVPAPSAVLGDTSEPPARAAAPLVVHLPETRPGAPSAEAFAERLRSAPAVALATLHDCPKDCRGGITELVAVDAMERLAGEPFTRAAAFFDDQFLCRGEKEKVWLVAVAPVPARVMDHPTQCDYPKRSISVDAEILALAIFDSAESARNYVRDIR
jgi:hypothetical protein